MRTASETSKGFLKTQERSWNLRTATETSGSWNLRTAHEISRLLLKPQDCSWNLRTASETSKGLLKPQNSSWNLRPATETSESWNLRTAHALEYIAMRKPGYQRLPYRDIAVCVMHGPVGHVSAWCPCTAGGNGPCHVTTHVINDVLYHLGCSR